MPEGLAKPLATGDGDDLTAGEGNTADIDLLLPSSDDVPSDDVVMSEDAIRSDDLCEGQDQSEAETEDHQVLMQTGLRIFDASVFNFNASVYMQVKNYMYYNDLL